MPQKHLDTKKTADGKELNCWLGVPEVYYIPGRNIAEDPYICYHNYVYDFYDVQDYLYENYEEICEEEGREVTDDGFEQYVKDNVILFLQDFDIAGYGEPYEKFAERYNERIPWNSGIRYLDY